jgi:hypothetical protein
MDAEGYRKLQPQYNELMSDVVNANINMLNILKTYGAAQDAALGQDHKEQQVEYVNKLKQGNKVQKSYNLMRLLTGQQPIAAYNDDYILPNTSQPKFYSGSSNSRQVVKETSEKVRKSYELMRLMTS